MKSKNKSQFISKEEELQINKIFSVIIAQMSGENIITTPRQSFTPVLLKDNPSFN